jgi:predicted ATPase
LIQAGLNAPEPILHRLRLSPQSARAALEEAVSQGEGSNLKELFIGSHRGGAILNVAGAGRRRRERSLSAGEYSSFASILAQIRDVGQYPEITHLAALYSQFRIYSEWTFGRTSKLREATPTSRTTATLSESMDDLALALNALEKTAAHEAIRVLLRELKETYVDYITRILFGRVGLELLEAPFESPLPAQRLSDGTLRFLALAAVLFQPTPPPLICLEEPELGMHPDMIRMVANMIADAATRTQLIVTTHSEYLLTCLQNDFDTLFAFDTGVAGSIVRRFSQAEYSVWREDHTLGELWTSGELGGNRW